MPSVRDLTHTRSTGLVLHSPWDGGGYGSLRPHPGARLAVVRSVPFLILLTGGRSTNIGQES